MEHTTLNKAPCPCRGCTVSYEKGMQDSIAAIQRVRNLHKPIADIYSITGFDCRQCGGTYPCTTIRALDGEQE